MILLIFLIVSLSLIAFYSIVKKEIRVLKGVCIFVLGFLQFILFLVMYVGSIERAYLPFILFPSIVALIILFFRKKLSLRIVAGILCVLLIVSLADFSWIAGQIFGSDLSFIEMPVQRKHRIRAESDHALDYENILSESVLIRNRPLDGTPLRDAMIHYLEEKTQGEDVHLYTRRSIRFYRYDSETRVFIDHESDPYTFARIRLDDMWDADLGYIWIDVNQERRLTRVTYRISTGHDTYSSKTRTDTLSIENRVNIYTVYDAYRKSQFQ